MIFLDSNESEPRNGSFDGRRLYGNNTSYTEKGPNIIVNRISDSNSKMNLIDKDGVIYGNVYNGPPLGRAPMLGLDPYQNFDEMNTSNENERLGSEEKKNRTFAGNVTYDYRQNRFGVVGLNNNMNNYSNINNNYINNLNNYNNMNMTNNNANMSQLQRVTPTDEVQEKYVTKTYDNMTYRDVKKL